MCDMQPLLFWDKDGGSVWSEGDRKWNIEILMTYHSFEILPLQFTPAAAISTDKKKLR